MRNNFDHNWLLFIFHYTIFGSFYNNTTVIIISYLKSLHHTNTIVQIDFSKLILLYEYSTVQVVHSNVPDELPPQGIPLKSSVDPEYQLVSKHTPDACFFTPSITPNRILTL